jgi:hypothetical protein
MEKTYGIEMSPSEQIPEGKEAISIANNSLRYQPPANPIPKNPNWQQKGKNMHLIGNKVHYV